MKNQNNENIIKILRTKKGLTQQQLADMLHVTDKAVSKWERNAGMPDISTIEQLCGIFNITAKQLLSGEYVVNKKENGNMKKTKFYVCKKCGAIYTSNGNGEINCCSSVLSAENAKMCDNEHMPDISVVEDEHYITISHPMSKQHYISFIAFCADERVFLIKMYPEQEAAVRFHKTMCNSGTLYFYCTEHGLFKADIG